MSCSVVISCLESKICYRLLPRFAFVFCSDFVDISPFLCCGQLVGFLFVLHSFFVIQVNLVSAQFPKYQTPPWMRNICYIARNSILTNKCSRTPPKSTGMPKWWWGNFSTICHRNNDDDDNNNNKNNDNWIAYNRFNYIW